VADALGRSGGDALAEGVPHSSRSHAVRVLIALLVAAINLRLAIAVVGPLIEDLRADLGISSTVAGALTTLPFVCMGIFAFIGPVLIRRYGTRAVLGWSLALIAAGTLVRAAMGTPLLLIATTLPIGLGMALGGVTIPIVIKQYFPHRPGAVTGAYTTALALGITVIGVTAVPLASALGSWREAFALSAAPAIVALPLWLAARVDDHRVATPPVSPAGVDPEPAIGLARLLPSRTGIMLGALFGLQSLCFAAIISWGPAVFQHAGWSPEAAALVVSVPGLLTIAASLSIPWLSDRGDRRRWLFAMVLLYALGLLGMTIDPGALGMLWIVLFGFGTGAVLPLCFALPLDLASSPARVGLLTAWMLGLGHLIAALGPTMTGALRDLSGGFTLPLALLFGLALADGALALAVPRRT
jgi:MFS transporter, CP family, cyanate transporter